VFSVLYSCARTLNDYFYTYFMHINVSGRSVLFFSKLMMIMIIIGELKDILGNLLNFRARGVQISLHPRGQGSYPRPLWHTIFQYIRLAHQWGRCDKAAKRAQS